MLEDNRIVKVEILIQQQRYKEAEKILSGMLSEDPNDILTLTMSAEVKLQQDAFDDADAFIDSAIGLSPSTGDLYYLKSRIAIHRDEYGNAEGWIQRAIEIDPRDADYHAVLASINLGRKQFELALENANLALEIDAENITALNVRSTALVKLDRKEESFQTIEGALREDPNNAYTHSNYGWGLLEKGDHEKSLIHFKQALSIDPNYEYAQAGLMEALKAKNPIYRLFLKYMFFMSKLTAKYQWGVIIGIYMSFRVLRIIANRNEALQPYIYPLLGVLAFVAFSTWVLGPISNLFLRFNKYGQLLLDKKEKMSSNFVAAGLTLFVIGIALYFIMSNSLFLAVAVYGFTMMVPFSVMFSPTKYENFLLYYAIGMALLGAAAVIVAFTSNEPFNMLSIVYFFGFIAFQWIANGMMISQNNR